MTVLPEKIWQNVLENILFQNLLVSVNHKILHPPNQIQAHNMDRDLLVIFNLLLHMFLHISSLQKELLSYQNNTKDLKNIKCVYN